MAWKKLLDTKDVIAYEKKAKDKKIRIEARFRKNRWRVYKTYNFQENGEWVSHVNEYIAASLDETQQLLLELKGEQDIELDDVNSTSNVILELERCYKEEFVEKWKLKIDNFSDDNYVHVRFDETIKLDIILHDRYNQFEKLILEKIIKSLGLRDISNRIQYDFFYYRKHSAKRRVYEKPMDRELIAQLEFNIDNMDNIDNIDP
ncbi:hypothetical protein H6503_01940 [Candidatus Woesearchaeota archaeon]|nr:hypothetical protein [Candidatus Woesearchaeota archaeon]